MAQHRITVQSIRVAQHRITVQNIVVWHERLGLSADEIATEHGLTLADVYAALAYYYDHREEIDRAIRADEDFIAELRKRTHLPAGNLPLARRGPVLQSRSLRGTLPGVLEWTSTS